MLGYGPFKRGKGRKKTGLGKAYRSRRAEPPVNKAAGRNGKAGRAALGGLFAVPSGSDDLEPDPNVRNWPTARKPSPSVSPQMHSRRFLP